jgi:thymidylate kinase
MAKIVELLGPSGVGKSSLYLELQNQWSEDDSWAVYHDLVYRRKGKDLVSLILKIKSLWSKVSCSDYFWNDGNLKDSQRQFADSHPEFMSVLMDLIQNHTKEGFNGEDKRFLVTFFSLKSIGRLQEVLKREDDKRTCLIDEALLSRIMHLNSPTFTQDHIEDYMSAMPLPDGLIYLNAPADLVLERVHKRVKTSTIHEGLSDHAIREYTENTQQLMESVIHFLNKKKIPVLRLDAKKSLKELSDRTIHFLEEQDIA